MRNKQSLYPFKWNVFMHKELLHLVEILIYGKFNWSLIIFPILCMWYNLIQFDSGKLFNNFQGGYKYKTNYFLLYNVVYVSPVDADNSLDAWIIFTAVVVSDTTAFCTRSLVESSSIWLFGKAVSLNTYRKHRMKCSKKALSKSLIKPRLLNRRGSLCMPNKMIKIHLLIEGCLSNVTIIIYIFITV